MKTGFWLKGGKGKLAGATVYQQNGETVMREVVSPTNPKTEKQIIQRIVMHTVMQSYSKMKDICDHSFEGLKKGQPTMAYFMSQNVGFFRQKVAEQQAQGVAFDAMYNFVQNEGKTEKTESRVHTRLDYAEVHPVFAGTAKTSAFQA